MDKKSLKKRTKRSNAGFNISAGGGFLSGAAAPLALTAKSGKARAAFIGLSAIGSGISVAGGIKGASDRRKSGRGRVSSAVGGLFDTIAGSSIC